MLVFVSVPDADADAEALPDHVARTVIEPATVKVTWADSVEEVF